MKNILFFGVLLLTAFGCKAQQIYLIKPMETHIDYIKNDLEIPDGIYFKDTNQLLDKYVGTWTGTYNNKTYEFQVIEYTDIFLGIKVDELLMRYKITNTNGTVVENTLTLPDSSPFVIEGRYLSEDESYYVLSYVGQESECGQDGDIFIEVTNSSNLTEMKLYLEPDIDLFREADCPNGMASQILPTNTITLTKQ